jgi:dephospho-CoA kinase
MPRSIGLTGGIAMGKTTISNHLRDRHGLTVLDADQYARQAVQPGSAILAQIVERYSAGILRPDGHLDRPQLGEIIFNDPIERQWVEAQIHPFVRSQMGHDRDQAYQIQSQQAQSQPVPPHQPVILVVPLLFEAGMTALVDAVWVVNCPVERQLAQLIQRDGLTIAQAEARLASQMPIATKIAQATQIDPTTVVLDNSSTLEYLLAQVDRALIASASPSD